MPLVSFVRLRFFAPREEKTSGKAIGCAKHAAKVTLRFVRLAPARSDPLRLGSVISSRLARLVPFLLTTISSAAHMLDSNHLEISFSARNCLGKNITDGVGVGFELGG